MSGRDFLVGAIVGVAALYGAVVRWQWRRDSLAVMRAILEEVRRRAPPGPPPQSGG